MDYRLPCLQIRSNVLIEYTESTAPRNFCRMVQPSLTKNLVEQKTYTGVITPGAKKRLIKSIEFMVMASKHKTIINPVNGKKQPFKIGFLTLTVYSTDRNITGKEAHKQCLEPFLLWMRRKHNCRLYIWKAELQARGQIHYHLTIDKFIHYEEVQSKWNELQKKAGYLDTFHNKYGHWNAPSIKIHAIKKEKNISGYLQKEIAKGFQNTATIGGKIWDCSTNLKNNKYHTVYDFGGEYNYKLRSMVERKEAIKIETDFCNIYKLIEKNGIDLLNDTDKLEYASLMENVRCKQLEPVKKIEFTTQERNAMLDIKQDNDLLQLTLPYKYGFENLFSSS